MQPAQRLARGRLASPTTWAATLGGLVAVSVAAVIPLSLLSHQYFNGVVPLVIGVPSAVVGILVARRQPGNPIGWLLLVIAGFLSSPPTVETTRFLRTTSVSPCPGAAGPGAGRAVDPRPPAAGSW